MSTPTSRLVVPDLLGLRAEYHPDQVALNVNGGAGLTYADWLHGANRVARGLLDRGVERGERIGILFSGLDWIDYAVAYLGVMTAGATAVHLHTGIAAPEMARRLDQCKVTGIVRGAATAPVPDFGGWSDTVAGVATGDGGPVKADIGPEDLAEILYTSGTTGRAKPIATPHGNLTFGRGPEGFRQLGDPKPLLAPIPLGTTSSATTTAVALSLSATIVLCSPDDVERMAELIEAMRIKSVMFTPWIGLQMAAARISERYDLTCVDTLATASAPLPGPIANRLLEMMPSAKITSVYAARECVPAVITITYDPARPLAVGRPAQGTDLLVVGPDSEPVATGEIGEVWLRSAAPKRVFLEGEERIEQAGNEWTRTRDLGYMGEDGDLYLFDREADAIRVGDKLVSSIATEGALYGHPAVQQAAVLGVPDPVLGQVPVAVLVLSGQDDLPGVREFAAEHLEPHQRPVRYHLVDSMPRGVMGKVLKYQLLKDLVPTTSVARADAEAESMFMGIMTGTGEDLYEDYRRLRERTPALLTGDGSLVLSRFTDCDASLRNRSLGKSDEWLKLQLASVSATSLRPVMELMQRSMILTNPPDHTRLRRLVSSAFTGRHVERLRETVTRRTSGLLADLAADPGADLMSRVAVPLPINTIGDLLGIPEDDRAGLIPHIHDLGLLMEPAAGPDGVRRGAAAQRALADYFAGLLAVKRSEPADDLLSRMAVSGEEGALDETEMIATALLLFGAGNTPTANLLGTGLCALLDHPDQLALLRADPGLIPGAVEEILRYDSPSQFDFYTVLEPVTLAGAKLEPGQNVITLLGAANHDPERFDDPDRFDVRRKQGGHLSFAAGIHHCLGAHLSRLQAEVFFAELLSGYSTIEYAEPPQRHPGLGNRGYSRVALRLER
ncbi:cytochrome P450 [Streptomyces sp. BBFR51]|uniref:cytochrome P450 n=1 Tax=Streptomyces sp. BBFR51 TaxID=3372856 RepID=UPI0037DD3DC9